MSANELIQLVTQAAFVMLFVIVMIRAIRWPFAGNIDVALFFGCIATLVMLERLVKFLAGDNPPEFATDAQTALILLFPYRLLRLADDYVVVPSWIGQTALGAAGISIALVFVFPEPVSGAALLVLLGYFFSTQLYAAVRFVKAARMSRGLLRRRLRAVSLGGALLLGIVGLAIPAGLFPGAAGLWEALANLMALASGVAFFAGFALPGPLKDAWQAPEVRRYLHGWSTSGWLGRDGIDDFARTVQDEIGKVQEVRPVVLWIWDEPTKRLTAPALDTTVKASPSVEAVFERQAASLDALDRNRPGPSVAAGVRAEVFLGVPVSRGPQRFGVLSAYGRNAAMFIDDDLRLLQVFADQTALALEHRAVVLELAQARARDEANRMKQEFLSSVAHDLQTPLTTLLGEAQLMERRAARDPAAPIDTVRTARMIEEGRRMRSMIREMLDSSQAIETAPELHLTALDLAALTREVAARAASHGRDLWVEADAVVPILGDPGRLRQLLECLLENAFNYSPHGGEVRVTVQVLGDDCACLRVSDKGIGISDEELPYVFDRFWRSRYVDDRQFAGLGLGLFTSRQIVEAHGGKIDVTSMLGNGTTFSVTLPLHASRGE
jgi:signal transduction histidine kinase